MADERDRLGVHLDAADLGPRQAVGNLIRERARATAVISFDYAPGWISSPTAFPLDPSLPLYEGSHYPPRLPGVFADAAPDRWGRVLLERREALAARREERNRRQLEDWDFLAGVSDRTRMGALRLAAADGAFVDAETPPVPPIARLRQLEHWAREFEEGLSTDLDEEEAWIAMLVAPGSSLGGARPKANFQDEDGTLWIAKFPSREDRHDVGRWEQVVCTLAARAGVDVPETRVRRLGTPYATFCAKRFDRIEGGGRRLYASAMTLTGRHDNEEASYLDIAQAIVNYGDPAQIDPLHRQWSVHWPPRQGSSP